ncbi:MAG: diguanylate cyclase [Planctomycetota bacterium]|nr:MAG: diguanylate cyclase [Planctomycetota bacterium]
MDKKILIVDDDPSTRRMLKEYLTASRYDICSAIDGKEALNILRSEEVQLIITDQVMPQMNGLDLCRNIRSFEGIGFVYIIILAASHDKNLIIKAFEAGADDYLSKPFHRGELLARVKAGVRIIDLEADLAKKNREVLKVNAEMAVLNNRLQEMATTDELTGLANRREAMEQLNNLWAMAQRHGHPLSCLMIDLDEFKSINDLHGHNAGDAVLKETAKLINKHTRVGDTVCRIGGEELLIISAHTTAPMAAKLAERLRKAVESNMVEFENKELCVTISVGVAERSKIMVTPDHLLIMADKALYAAKSAGRNKVCTAPFKTVDNTSDQPVGDSSRR